VASQIVLFYWLNYAYILKLSSYMSHQVLKLIMKGKQAIISPQNLLLFWGSYGTHTLRRHITLLLTLKQTVHMVTTVLEVIIYSHDLHMKEATGCGDGRTRLHVKAHIQRSRISRYYMMSYLLMVYLTTVSISQIICTASNRKMITNNDFWNTEGPKNVYTI
jgi:hypothetical protein